MSEDGDHHPSGLGIVSVITTGVRCVVKLWYLCFLRICWHRCWTPVSCCWWAAGRGPFFCFQLDYSPWHKDLVRAWLQVSKMSFRSKTWLMPQSCSAKSFLTNKERKCRQVREREGSQEHLAKATEVPSNSVSKLWPNADALFTGDNSGMPQIAQNYLRETGLAGER